MSSSRNRRFPSPPSVRGETPAGPSALGKGPLEGTGAPGRGALEETGAPGRSALEGTGALVKVGHRCDQRCLFCHAAKASEVDASDEHVRALIERTAALGHRRVVLSGGEPTLRRELVGWADRAAALGLGFGLVSNGQRLADPTLVDALVARGLEYVHLSLHGPRQVHREAVGVDGHPAVRSAIALLGARGIRVVVNCVVTQQNLAHLGELARELEDAGPLVLKYSLVEPKGEALARYETIVPKVADAARCIVTVIHESAARGSPDLELVHDGVPLCLLPGMEQRRSDLRSERLTMMAEATESDLYPVDDRNRVHPPRCRTCGLRGRCPGLFRATYEREGEEALGPARRGALGNSFHYVLQRWRQADGESCPVADEGTAPWDRGRDLWVRHGGRVALYRCEGRDFTDEEMEQVKQEHEQLYFDSSGEIAGEDFGRDRVALRRHPGCAECADQPRCTGLYEPLWRDLLAPFRASLREMLGTFRGDVLDIGCGAGLYCDALEPAARAGGLRYLGVDPDPVRIKALLARHPWATVRLGSAETLVPTEPVDHLLLLGSWNHLSHPVASVAQWLPRLRVRGTLLISDDAPFALARSRSQARIAERSGARPEHHRLDKAADVLAALSGFPLAVQERHDVGPETGPRWLLRLRKSEDGGAG